MALAAGIVTLLASLAGLLVWWIRRSAAKADDPVEQNRRRYGQIDQDIQKRDGLAATAHGSADLDELQRLQDAGGGGKR